MKVIEKASGRAATATHAPRGSTVNMGDGNELRIYGHDEHIIEFEDGEPPTGYEGVTGRKWCFVGAAFHRAFTPVVEPPEPTFAGKL